jgi:hypothetical protein
MLKGKDIKDVAKAAGLSPATVARFAKWISGSTAIPQATVVPNLLTVFKCARALGYETYLTFSEYPGVNDAQHLKTIRETGF